MEIRKHGYYSYSHPPKGLVEVMGIETHSIIAQSWPHTPTLIMPFSATPHTHSELPRTTQNYFGSGQSRNRPKSKEEATTLKLGLGLISPDNIDSFIAHFLMSQSRNACDLIHHPT